MKNSAKISYAFCIVAACASIFSGSVLADEIHKPSQAFEVHNVIVPSKSIAITEISAGKSPTIISRLVKGENSENLLYFSNCKQGTDGKCKLSFSMNLISPQGKMLLFSNWSPLLNEAPPASGSWGIGPFAAPFHLPDVQSAKDGQYLVMAFVKDEIAAEVRASWQIVELISQ